MDINFHIGYNWWYIPIIMFIVGYRIACVFEDDKHTQDFVFGIALGLTFGSIIGHFL